MELIIRRTLSIITRVLYGHLQLIPRHFSHFRETLKMFAGLRITLALKLIKTCGIHYVDNRSTMYTNIIAVCYENHIKHVNILWGGGVPEFCMIKLLLHLVTAVL